jgi:hypothetical protein
MKPHVALALPSRASLRKELLIGAMVHAGRQCQVLPFTSSSSLLNHCFNNLWTCLHNLQAVQGFDYVALLHDDIQPDYGWVDTLVAEMGDADFISAVVPIKDDRGLTSTATYQGDIWDFKRLTMREVAGLPVTFGAEEVGGNLLLNTGCCVLRMRGPWLEHPEQFCFESRERLDRRNGQWIASVISEDWLWTDKLRQAGAKLVATRKVALAHEGGHDYRNDSIWGRWSSDKAFLERHSHEDQVSEGCELSAERPGELAVV